MPAAVCGTQERWELGVGGWELSGILTWESDILRNKAGKSLFR